MTPLSDEELRCWAREHLIYEGRMLAFTAVRLAERQGVPRDPVSNAYLESFVVHVRCLRDFLWGNRKSWNPLDAFAFDFCVPGEWEAKRGQVPPNLSGVDTRKRTGREVVHLTYHRLSVEAELKDWECGEIFGEIADALACFTTAALPTRLDAKTRDALQDLFAHSPGAGTISVATGAVYGTAIQAGTIAFPGFEVGS